MHKHHNVFWFKSGRSPVFFHKISVRKPGATEQTEVLKHTVGLSLGNAILPEVILGVSFST